nr:unnamed protein product [Callosobruchus chinensis]
MYHPNLQCASKDGLVMECKHWLQSEDGDDESKMCICQDEEESSSSDSELDIEFTPPAGIIHPERFKKKKNVVHTDTQYDPEDFATKKEKGGKGKGKDKKGKGGKGKKEKKGKKK